MGERLRNRMILRSVWTSMLVRSIVVVLVATFAASSLGAASSDRFSNPAVTARLISADNAVSPTTQTLTVGLDLTLGDGWKTYWRTPGEVGFAPSLDWSQSDNLDSAELLWPAPERFTAFGIENFGYHGRVVLPVRLTLKDPGRATRLAAKVSLLTCSDICVPQDFLLTLDLPRGVGIDTEATQLLTQYIRKVPKQGLSSGINMITAALEPESAALVLTARSPDGFGDPDVFPEFGPYTTFGKPDIRTVENSMLLWARLPILSLADDLPELRITITDGARAATFPIMLSDQIPPAPYALAAVVPDLSQLIWIGLIAFLGGVILNAMPCVLPVLSIKLSSVLSVQDQTRSFVRRSFFYSALGVVAFCWVLALAVLLAQASGVTVGWGLQFQNPVFVTFMFVLLVLFAANLFGAYEISLPSSLQTRLARSSAVSGHVGDFATGAFAAVLATPCSAPFLGTAVAFALSGRPVDVVLVFTALGAGLAAPYILIAAAPGLIACMPRPGRWMLAVKIVLGALLAGTAAWLLWVIAGLSGGLAAGSILALTIVLVGAVSLRGVPHWPKTVALAVFAITPFLVASGVSDSKGQVVAATSGKIDWVSFERNKIAKLVSQGNTVFVDVTADWCLTCKANKALVLDRDVVAEALNADHIVSMQADWTRPDESISRYLESHDRFGIPFNVVYGPGAPEGIILSELLTPSAVVDALSVAGARSVVSQ